MDYEYRWASDSGAHSMAHPDELRYFGYEPVERDGVVVRDPRYQHSVLMRRAVA